MPIIQKISPCLWFDSQAEAAARHYTTIFDGHIGRVARYGHVGQEIHQRDPGSVMTVEFEILNCTFTALNGGPVFKFNEAVSLQIFCDTQEELDRYWTQLSDGGDPNAQQCGWLKDKYGLCWQLVPSELAALLSDPDQEKADRAMKAMLSMKKLDIAALKRAYAG